MAEVPVNGKVLEWARTIRGLEIDSAADLLHITSEELRALESGATKPLVSLLRLMSERYQINFTSLLMPEPLPIKKRPTDHRARRGARPLSIETIVAIQEVGEALEAFEDIGYEAESIVPKLNIGAAQIEDDPEAVAARERRRFGVSVEEQQAWHNLYEARREWRQRIENRGVFTYMIPMPAEELSGFSLLHDGLAAICVNDREPTEGAKVFTLLHEYCHLLLRQSGISDENNSNRTERFCNEFAASFLIPRGALVEETKGVVVPHEFSDAEVKQLAARFRVSNSAMALRLEKIGLAAKGFSGRRTGPWDLPVERRPTASVRQPDYLKIRMKRLGRLHTATIMRALKRHAINTFDASDLIGVKPGSLGKLEAALG